MKAELIRGSLFLVSCLCWVVGIVGCLFSLSLGLPLQAIGLLFVGILGFMFSGVFDPFQGGAR